MSQPPRPLGPPTQPLSQLPSQPLRRKRFGWVAMIIAVVGGFAVGATVVALGSSYAGTLAAITAVAGTAPNDEPPHELTDEPMAAEFTPRRSDFEVGIKILEEKCFGSGGCSVGFRIKPKYVGTQELPDEGTIEVSYRITGDESGPRQNTFKIVDGHVEFDEEEFAGTRSFGTVLKAKVIDVSYSEN